MQGTYFQWYGRFNTIIKFTLNESNWTCFSSHVVFSNFDSHLPSITLIYLRPRFSTTSSYGPYTRTYYLIHPHLTSCNPNFCKKNILFICFFCKFLIHVALNIMQFEIFALHYCHLLFFFFNFTNLNDIFLGFFSPSSFSFFFFKCCCCCWWCYHLFHSLEDSNFEMIL